MRFNLPKILKRPECEHDWIVGVCKRCPPHMACKACKRKRPMTEDETAEAEYQIQAEADRRTFKRWVEEAP